jgi:hypothetical protein
VKQLLRLFSALLSSRVTSFLVIGFFLLLYIGIAFVTDETLVALMDVTRKSLVLTMLLALLPLNIAARMVKEVGVQLKRGRAFAGKVTDLTPELFDETVVLQASPSFAELAQHLNSLGYKSRVSETALAACRGFGLFPLRLLYLVGTFCLFAGIAISLSSRSTLRGVIIEGEQLPASSGRNGTVERIVLADSSGLILAKTLDIEVSRPAGQGSTVFGLYPPALHGGKFVYPRYLGVGVHLLFSAPDMPGGYETRAVLNIYPPGKEDSVEIPQSPYRMVASLVEPGDGSDPYETGRLLFRFKLLREKEVVFEGSAASGGEFVANGYRLSFPDSRRVVITDFIQDPGVLLIWAAPLIFVVAGCIWLPVRLFFPRRELMFSAEGELVRAFTRAEGKRSSHRGVFHEALDRIVKTVKGEST